MNPGVKFLSQLSLRKPRIKEREGGTPNSGLPNRYVILVNGYACLYGNEDDHRLGSPLFSLLMDVGEAPDTYRTINSTYLFR